MCEYEDQDQGCYHHLIKEKRDVCILPPDDSDEEEIDDDDLSNLDSRNVG